MQGGLRADRGLAWVGQGCGWAALVAWSGKCRGEWGLSIVAEYPPGGYQGRHVRGAQGILRHHAGPLGRVQTHRSSVLAVPFCHPYDRISALTLPWLEAS